jgi:hypothetical protein
MMGTDYLFFCDYTTFRALLVWCKYAGRDGLGFDHMGLKGVV